MITTGPSVFTTIGNAYKRNQIKAGFLINQSQEPGKECTEVEENTKGKQIDSYHTCWQQCLEIKVN